MERRAYSIKEAAEMIGISSRKLYDMVQKQEIKSRRVGWKILIPSWAIDEFLKKPE